MIVSKPICRTERTTRWHWLFPKVCNSAMNPGRPKFFVRLLAMTFGILGLAFIAGEPTSVTAEQSYPWCAQGDNTLHCYYTTREQCEAAVNYHGFCVGNSNVPTLNNEAPQRPLRRRRQI
jgi:hypothetical protein